MPGVGICIRINRYGFNGQSRGSGRHPAGNFSAIGDKDFAKHVMLDGWLFGSWRGNRVVFPLAQEMQLNGVGQR
jgi:hypothetical protein